MATATELSPESELQLAEVKVEITDFFGLVDSLKKGIESLTLQIAALDTRMAVMERKLAL